MKKAIYIILTALLLASCASKKHVVKTESGDTQTTTQTTSQQTDSNSSQQTTTQTIEVATDSITETLTFQLADSGSVKIAADGQITAAGVKSFTKQTKRRQNGRKEAKTENLAHLDYHANINNIASEANTHWQKADSTKVEPVKSTGGSWQDWLLNTTATIILAALGLAVGWYITKKIFSHTN